MSLEGGIVNTCERERCKQWCTDREFCSYNPPENVYINNRWVSGVMHVFLIISDSYHERMLAEESKQTKTKPMEDEVKVGDQQWDI